MTLKPTYFNVKGVVRSKLSHRYVEVDSLGESLLFTNIDREPACHLKFHPKGESIITLAYEICNLWYLIGTYGIYLGFIWDLWYLIGTYGIYSGFMGYIWDLWDLRDLFGTYGIY